LASPGQQALWQFHQLNPGSHAYNMVAARELRADLDAEALCAAFARVVEHCETLHCGYREVEGQLWMARPEQIRANATWECLDDLDAAGVKAWIEHHADEPFDLASANVCRLRLLRNQGRLYLCMAAHHISGDFLTVEWMLKLTFAAYHAHLTGEPLDLPAPGLYFEWLEDNRELLEESKLASLASYWRAKLSGAPAALELTPDHPRPRNPDYEGDEFELLLSESQSNKLRAMADTHQVSLFVLLAGLFQVFMHRCSDQDDFLIGTPTMDRHKAKYKNLMGFTLNSLPLRARFEHNPTLADCLRDVAQQMREGLRHRRYPSTRMQEDVGSGPLFRCMLTYMPSRRDEQFGEYSVQEHLFTQRGAANDLNLRWQDDGVQLLAQWRYRTDLFDARRIARLAEHFAWFANQAVQMPGARVSDLPACPPSAASSSHGLDSQPAFATAVEAFDHQVRTHRDRTALSDTDGSLTYAQLDQAAEALAQQLRNAGAGPGQIVALVLPRGRTLMTAMLASWKLGSAYLCLDPALPQSRRQQLLEDSAASVWIGPDQTLYSLAHGTTVAPTSAVLAHAQQLAYLIYTSGSTGTPKAVRVTQGNLIHYVDGVMRSLALSENASLTALASVAADLGYTAWFGALLTGRTLRLIDEQLAADPEELAQSLAAAPVDCLKIVPSHLNALLAVASPERLLPRQCLVLGGEGLDLTLVKRLQAISPGCRIINHYGPTETTVGCLTQPVTGSDETFSGFAPIGAPLANVNVHVLDRHLDPMPLGSAGELYIGGPGVADGYLGQPGQTAQRFIPNPFSGVGQRLYRTGDRARLLPSGAVEFLGRIDDQVKIRGFRVEPGEIEACIRACHGVREAVVVARTLGDHDAVKLIAYLVPDAGLDRAQLREQLATQLPEPMLPSLYVELTELPRLANGKVDRHNLPAPTDGPRQDTLDAGPRDPVEALLLDLWCEVLGRPSLSIHDDFFALGGDSILALQLIASARKAKLKFTPKHFFAHPTIARLAATLDSPLKQLEAQLLSLWAEVLQRTELGRQDDFFAVGGDSIIALQLIAKARKQGLRFSPKELFAHPRIEALASLLSHREPPKAEAAPQASANPAPPAFALSPDERKAVDELAGTELEDAYPLSPLQKGLLFHSLLENGNGVYVNQLQAELQGPLDPARYLSAWRDTFAAHPLMRTGILWQGLEEPLQGVYRDLQLPVRQLDWSALDEAQRQQAMADYCVADRALGFDPQRPPLQRIALIRLDEQRTWLVWSRHHLIADGWSSVMLMEEILARYNGLAINSRPPYRAYIDWLAAQPDTQSQAYWQQRLAGFEGAGSLPVLAPTESAAAEHYYTRSLQLDETQTTRLNALGKHARVTLNTLVQAAWGLLLARHNNQPDVMFGVTSSGRPGDLPDAGQMLGVFINTLPLRLQVDSGLTLGDYLHQVQATSVAMREHEQTPLAEILQQHPRGAALFDTLLVFQNLPALGERQLQSGELTLKVMDNLEQTSYGLTVEALPGRRLEMLFSADARRLPVESLQALVDDLHRLLLAMDTAPDTRLEQLSILTADERVRLLGWGTHRADYSLEGSWEQRVAQRVAAHPERLVARCADQSLTYAQLWQRSQIMARGLQALGAQPDQPIALLADRGLDWLCLMVATLRAGCGWLALEPSQPPARWQQVLARLEQPMVICSPEYAERLASVYQGKYALPNDLVEMSTLGRLPPQPARQDQLAYVLFTSGSTGQPKGVMVTRAGMLNNMLAKLEPLGLNQNDVIAQTAPACFDISVWQALTAPLFGACVEIIGDNVVRDPQALLQVLRTRHVSLFEPVPALLQAMLESQSDQPMPLPNLRWVLPTGEALPVATAQQWFRHYPHIPLMNAYGPAECSDDVAFQPLRNAPDQGTSVAIGRPTANAELYVLGHDLQPVPKGVVGELAIGGIGVSRGYLADPSRTAASFIPNPFGAAGTRLYLSGDLARWDEDGVLQYFGRKDFQLKLRGFRIEPGEIEAHLERHPDILRAMVSLRKLGSSDMLVGYWQGRQGHALTDAALARFVRDGLPAYMVPSLWVQMDNWPQNANGKVDRKALPAPTLDSVEVDPPSSANEQLLAELWATLLPPQPLGRNSHFFEAGGHSLLATRLIARIRQRCGLELALRSVFDAPLLWQQAQCLDILSTQPANAAVLPVLRPIDRQAHMPLSLSQHRLWMIDRLHGPSAAYNMAATLRLHGSLDINVLRATFNALLDRHEVLRTAYSDIDGEPVSSIATHLEMNLPVRDVSQLDAGQRQAVADQESLDNLRLPFNLAQAPLIRARLLKLDEHEHLLFLGLHHMVADGWSVGVLINELSEVYAALHAGKVAQLLPLPVQYADYAHWQRECLQGPSLEKAVTFWQEHLRGAPQVLALPTDWPRPAQADARGAAKALEIPAPLLARLEALALAEGVTLYMVLLSTFEMLLHQLTGNDELLLGTDVAGRDNASLEGLIGFFVNVLPLRSRRVGDERFSDFLARTRDTCLQAFEHQALPFDRIVEALQVPRERSRNPLVQALFVLQNTPQAEFALPGLEAHLLPAAERTSKFDMALFLERQGDVMRGDWVYARALFKGERIEALIQAWLGLLHQVVEQPCAALAHFTIPLPPVESSALANSPSPSSKLDKLKKMPARAAAPKPLIRTAPLLPGREFPLMIEPCVPDLDPVGWAQSSRDLIDTLLCQHAGVLFRGFALGDAKAFEAFAEAIHPGLFGGYGDLPKKEGGRNIYRSTPYPEREMILFHNESSHLPRSPRKQWFFCELPSPVGGATPIVDCRELYRRLPPALAARFESKGLLYVRTFTERLDVNWREFFKTDDRDEVEAQCRASGTEFHWLVNDELQIRTRCPAVIRHPLSGERSFFNQIQLHHTFCLDPQVREDLLRMVGQERMPRQVFFGDGSPIDSETMALVGRLYEECAVRFDWQQGDVIMLDNLLAAHARDPFEGPRKIVVAMGDLHEPAHLADYHNAMELQD
jgi:amino acid adenylation domain-containing protein